MLNFIKSCFDTRYFDMTGLQIIVFSLVIAILFGLIFWVAIIFYELWGKR